MTENNIYTYNGLKNMVSTAYVFGNWKATPPYIAVEMLKDYFEWTKKPETVNEWIERSWSKRKDWYEIHLYCYAISTMWREGIISVNPDLTYEVLKPEYAESIIEWYERTRERYEEERKKYQELKKIAYELFYEEKLPEFADCVEENDELYRYFSNEGKWLWLNNRNRNTRLVPNSIVGVLRYKRYVIDGVEITPTVNLIAKLIEHTPPTAKVEFLCNLLTTEIPDYYIRSVLVDSKTKENIIFS